MEDDGRECHICRDQPGKISPCKCTTLRVCPECLRKMREQDSRCRVCKAEYPKLKSWSRTCSCSCSPEAVCISICAAFVMAIFTVISGGMLYSFIHGDEYSASRLGLSLLYGVGLIAGMVALAGLCLCIACFLTRTRVQPSNAV